MLLRPDIDLDALLEDAATLRCPHCDVFVRMSVHAAPDWAALVRERPARIGIILVCSACSLPVHLQSGRTSYETDAIRVEDGFTPVIRPRPRFETRLLPGELRALVEEALACYADGRTQAFALLANRIATIAAALLGANGKLTLFNTVTAAADAADIDAPIRRLCRDILFSLGNDDEPPELPAGPAAVLLELLKDLLHQSFVRPGRLREAMRRVEPASLHHH